MTNYQGPPIRIGIIADALNDARVGMATYTYELLRHVAALPGDHEVFAVNTRPVDLPGVRTIVVPNPFPRLETVLWYATLPWRLRDADLHVLHAPRHFPLFSRRPALVLTVHDLGPVLFPEADTASRAALFRWAYAPAARAAAAIIAASEATRRDVIRHLRVPAERVTVTYQAAAPDVFGPPDAASRWRIRQVMARHAIEGPYVLFVGTLQPRKNVEGLLHAWRMVAPHVPHTLVLSGERGWNYHAIFETMDALDLTARVRYVGHTSDADLAPLYQGASLFVLPSWHEGFGLTPLEAMACGTPVVTTGAGSLPEVVGDAALVVPAGDVAALARAMRAALTDPDLAARMSARGLERAASFSWRRCAEETLAVYRRTVGLAVRWPRPRPSPPAWPRDDGRPAAAHPVGGRERLGRTVPLHVEPGRGTDRPRSPR